MPNAPSPPSTRNPLGALAPLLVAGGFMVGHAVVVGWPRWPVGDASVRVVYWVGVAAVLGVVADLVCDRSRRWLLPLLAAGAAMACLLPNLSARRDAGGWSAGELAAWVALLAGVVAGLATLTHRLARRDAARPLVPLVLLGMTCATAGLLMSTGSKRLGESTFCLAAATGAYALLGLLVPSVARSAGAVIVALAAVVTQLASGHLWSETPPWTAAPIAAAPLIAWSVALGPIARRPRPLAVAIALLLAALPAALTVGPLAAQALTETRETTGGADEVW